MEKSSANNTVHLINKKLGETPNEAILRFKDENLVYKDVSMTYAGRLDPMAEGLLLVLSGDEINHKEKYLGMNKTYRFEILWGFKTDTLDLLGLVSENEKTEVDDLEIKKVLEKSIGRFEQMYPIYSSRPVGGKSLFQWAREGRISEVEIPKHEVEIFETKYVGRKSISVEDLQKEIISRVEKVRGDFRQKEIKEKWEEILSNSKCETYFIDTIELKVSSGFYVRQFVTDLAEKLGALGVTFSINRVQIGDYCV